MARLGTLVRECVRAESHLGTTPLSPEQNPIWTAMVQGAPPDNVLRDGSTMALPVPQEHFVRTKRPCFWSTEKELAHGQTSQGNDLKTLHAQSCGDISKGRHVVTFHSFPHSSAEESKETLNTHSLRSAVNGAWAGAGAHTTRS